MGEAKSRQTTQRDAITRTLRHAAGPLTTRELFEAARAHCPHLGIATVYRTVKHLSDHDQIRSITLPDGKLRYEDAGLGHHAHFTCRTCESVFDLDICPSCVPDGTTLPGGFHVESHELTLFGVCPTCGGDGASTSEGSGG